MHKWLGDNKTDGLIFQLKSKALRAHLYKLQFLSHPLLLTILHILETYCPEASAGQNVTVIGLGQVYCTNVFFQGWYWLFVNWIKEIKNGYSSVISDNQVLKMNKTDILFKKRPCPPLLVPVQQQIEFLYMLSNDRSSVLLISLLKHTSERFFKLLFWGLWQKSD